VRCSPGPLQLILRTRPHLLALYGGTGQYYEPFWLNSDAKIFSGRYRRAGSNNNTPTRLLAYNASQRELTFALTRCYNSLSG
jgi:hypothetical protein